MTGLTNLAPRHTANTKAPRPTVDAVRDEMDSRNGQSAQNSNLSIETVNLVGKENSALVARLIVDAGRRARNAVAPPRASLSRTALAFLLASEKARGRELTAADSEFLADYVESVSVARHDD